MIQIINPELFSITGEQVTDTERPHYKGKIDTAPVFVGANGEPSKLRPILRVIAPNEEYNSYDQVVSSKTIESKTEKGSNISLLVKALDRKFNGTPSDIYAIAFPFHGIVKPVGNIPGIRILKGMISVSAQYSINWNDEHYKNAMYLVVAVDPEVWEKNPDDTVSMTVEAYSLKTSGKKKDIKTTVCESFTLILRKDPTKYEFSYTHGEVEPVDMKQYQGLPVWEIYHIPEMQKKPTQDNKPRQPQTQKRPPVHNNQANKSTSGKKPAYRVEGTGKSAPQNRPPHATSAPVASRKPVRKEPESASAYTDGGEANAKLDDMISRALADGRYGGKGAKSKNSGQNRGKKNRR